MKKNLYNICAWVLLVMCLVPHPAWAVESIIFTDTCNSNPAVTINNSTSITVGTSWSAKITLDGNPATTITNGTTACGSTASEANDGHGYTMTPAATTRQYYIDFTFVDLGTVGLTDAIGVLINYTDNLNFYACTTTDDDSGAVDAYIIKTRAGSGSTLASATDIARTLNGDTLVCRIDYTGTNPVISFYDQTEGAFLVASTTDSASPLSYSGTAGVLVGSTPARTTDDMLIRTALAVDQLRLTTVSGPPRVTTSTTFDITNISKRLVASIDSLDGGSNATVRGFAWGTSSTLATTLGTSTNSGSFSTGQFTEVVGGLMAGVTYYYRAYATNPDGTGYGTIQSFVAGTDTTATRRFRLFEGFTVKIQEGGTVIIHQQ